MPFDPQEVFAFTSTINSHPIAYVCWKLAGDFRADCQNCTAVILLPDERGFTTAFTYRGTPQGDQKTALEVLQAVPAEEMYGFVSMYDHLAGIEHSLAMVLGTAADWNLPSAVILIDTDTADMVFIHPEYVPAVACLDWIKKGMTAHIAALN